VLTLFSWSLQGAEHYSSQHQVENHSSKDGKQGGAAHGCTSAQFECRLLLLWASLSIRVAVIPAAAAETSAITKADRFYTDHRA